MGKLNLLFVLCRLELLFVEGWTAGIKGFDILPNMYLSLIMSIRNIRFVHFRQKLHNMIICIRNGPSMNNFKL